MSDSAFLDPQNPKFKELLEALIQPLHTLDEKYRPISSGNIWHYTNLEALVSIVTNKTIRISAAQFLNDKGEVREGLKILHKIVNENNDLPIEIKKEINHFETNPMSLKLLVASFTTRRDDLSQWRAYAKVNGLAFSIDLSRCSIVKHTNKTHQGYFYRVIYDNNEYINIIKKFIDNFILNVMPILNNCSSDERNDFYEYFSRFIVVRFPVLFKDACFEPEDEVRFMIINPESKKIKFRVSSGLIVPYIDVNFSTNSLQEDTSEFIPIPIREVILGPTIAEKSVVEEGLRILFGTNGYQKGQVQITHSSIPFRG